MKNKRIVLSCLTVLSISMGGNIVCSYDEGDRILAKTMKIAEQADFVTIEVCKLPFSSTV